MYSHFLTTGLVAFSYFSGAHTAPASSSDNVLPERAMRHVEVNTGSDFWASVPRRDAFAVEDSSIPVANKRDEEETVTVPDEVADEVDDEDTSGKGGSSSGGGGRGGGGSGGRRGGSGGTGTGDDEDEDENAAPRAGPGLTALGALVGGWILMTVAM